MFSNRKCDQLHRLIFASPDDDSSNLSHYDSVIEHNSTLSNEIRDGLYDSIRTQIASNFRSTNDKCGRVVSRFCSVPRLGFHVAFILLCDKTDEKQLIRNDILRMIGSAKDENSDIEHATNSELKSEAWPDYEIVKNRSAKSADASEYSSLLHWLTICTGSYDVRVYPSESVLRESDDNCTVALELCSVMQKGECNKSPKSHLVFIMPNDLVHRTEYMRKRVKLLVDEALNSRSCFYVVVNIGEAYGVQKLNDVISVEDCSRLCVKCSFGVVPDSATCVVIRLSVNTGT